MNLMNQMIGDYFYVLFLSPDEPDEPDDWLLFLYFLSPDETYKTDGRRNDYLVHLVHLVMINSIQQRRYEYLAVWLIVFVAFAG